MPFKRSPSVSITDTRSGSGIKGHCEISAPVRPQPMQKPVTWSITQVLMQGVETFIIDLCHKQRDQENNLGDLLCGTCDIASLPANHPLGQTYHG